MVEANIRIVSDLKMFLEHAAYSREEKLRYAFSEKDFTRKRSLPFCTLALLILNLPKRSLSVEVSSFFAHVKQKSCSKAAFCLQRVKLKPFFFQSWNRILTGSFYRHYGEKVKRWKGFLLLAFDGSVFSLPNTEALRATYGNASSNKGEHGAVARSSVVYDVLNCLVLEGKLHPYSSSERSVVAALLEQVPENSLLTFDRGYPCFWLFYLLERKPECKFVMRLHADFNSTVKAFMRSSAQESVEIFHPHFDTVKQMQAMGLDITKAATVKLRLVKVALETGETEVLATNLYAADRYSASDLKEVYFLRWGVETFYGFAKNQLQVEIFSGIRQLCVEQDYFASWLVFNLQSLVEKQSEQATMEVNKRRKLDYKVNKNLSWASLKNRVVDLFMKNENATQILLELQALFQQHLEPVRPNRKFPRRRRAMHGNGKYRTLTNYKRTI